VFQIEKAQDALGRRSPFRNLPHVRTLLPTRTLSGNRYRFGQVYPGSMRIDPKGTIAGKPALPRSDLPLQAPHREYRLVKEAA